MEIAPWLNKSAEQRNDDVQFLLGRILYEGKLVAADRVAAGQWILLADAAGNANARTLFKEMQLFLTAAELAEARQRADGFKPVKKTIANAEIQTVAGRGPRLDAVALPAPTPDDELLALDEALTRLAEINPQGAELGKLCFFVGLTQKQAAK
jgi:TPR repeat protein